MTILADFAVKPGPLLGVILAALPVVSWAAPGDGDGDRDVDLHDVAGLQVCFTGAGGTVTLGCEVFDLDGDGDSDLDDFALFGCVSSGPDSVLPAVVVEDPMSPTRSSILKVVGTAAGWPAVEIVGGLSAVNAPVTDCAFSATIELRRNRLNQIFVRGVRGGVTMSAATTLHVIHDEEPPTLFIDLPADGAEIPKPTTDVAGRVSDTLSGFEGLRVLMNGRPAEVDIGIGTNGTFFLPGLTLNPDAQTPIEAVAIDAVGNASTVRINVTRTSIAPDAARMTVMSGNGQTAQVGTILAEPIVVQVTTADGQPLPHKLVTFDVTRNNGRLSPDPKDDGVTSLQVFTDSDGLASAFWRLGSDAGCGNNRVAVTSRDIAGAVTFCASATPAPPGQINIGSGNYQRAEAGGPAPEPLRVWVSDACNGVRDVPVTFKVVRGGGAVNGAGQTTILTSATGHAPVSFTLGPQPGNNVVEATFPSNPGLPARFDLVGITRDPVAPTTFSGIVLNNAEQPIQGATCTLSVMGVSVPAVQSDVNGVFRFDDIPHSGPADLIVDGATAFHVGGSDGSDIPPGSYPSLHYEPVLVPNAANSLSGPVLLPPLNPANAVLFDNTQDVELTVEGIEGLRMLVKAGSMTMPDGTVPSPENAVTLSLNQVHHDDVPMPMPDGAAPPFAWTLQPGGARFDPPIQITYPNMSGLPAGAIAYFLSFNHDTMRFDIVAGGQVTGDGQCIVTDPGAGISVAGWGCNCPPYSVTGSCCACPPGDGCSSCDPDTCESESLCDPDLEVCDETLEPRQCQPICENPLNFGTDCDDGNLCTQNDSCYGGVCAGVVPSVEDDPTLSGCQCVIPGEGSANGQLCDDGDPATGPGTCQAGACSPGPNNCSAADSDDLPCVNEVGCPGTCVDGTCLATCCQPGVEDGDPCGAIVGGTCQAGTCQGLECVPEPPGAVAGVDPCLCDPDPCCGSDDPCCGKAPGDLCKASDTECGTCSLGQCIPTTVDDLCQCFEDGDQCDGGICLDGVCLECVFETDCAAGQICVANECKTPCETHADCEGVLCISGICDDSVCDPACPEGDVCFLGACLTPCESDADCDDGDPCTDQDLCDTELGVAICQNFTTDCGCAPGDGETCCCAPNGERGVCSGALCAACVTDADCFEGVCFANECKTPCATHADCDEGHGCLAGFCDDSVCDPVCPQGQLCYESECETPCNTDADCEGVLCLFGICDDSVCDPVCPEGDVCFLGACLTPCENDADCDDGDSCTDQDVCDTTDGICQNFTTDCGCAPGDGEACSAPDGTRGHCSGALCAACVTDADCFDEGHACRNGECLPLSCTLVPDNEGCASELECVVDALCRAGVCVPIVTRCDGDCVLACHPACETCEDGFCTARPDPNPCCGEPEHAACQTDDDPCTTEECRSQICMLVSECDPGDPSCCGVCEICVDGQCEPDPIPGPCCGQPNGTPCETDSDPCTTQECGSEVCLVVNECDPADPNCCDPCKVCEDGECVPDPFADVCCGQPDGALCSLCPNCGLCARCISGLCSALPDGTACENGVACGFSDCQAGVCTDHPDDCSVLDDECNVGQCDANSGQCLPVPRPNGTPCTDLDPCTNDACQDGTCVSTPIPGCP